MGDRQSGFINSASASILLLLLLSGGLYLVAMNPPLAGFAVQSETQVAAQFKSIKPTKEQNSAASQDSLLENNVWGQTSPPKYACLIWYEVRKGDTEWDLSAKYAASDDRWKWINTMRRVSGKSETDEKFVAGEKICIEWN